LFKIYMPTPRRRRFGGNIIGFHREASARETDLVKSERER